MIRTSSTENIVKKLEEEIQVRSKLISAYKIDTPEFQKLVPDEYYVLETKKFLVLKAMNRDITTYPVLKPSRAIDELWTMFMTCMDEYIEFCESILPETVVEHRYIKKIGYDDDRYLENGFEHCLQEYSKLFSEDMLSTLLWNRRYKNDSYKEILEKAKSSDGQVYHSPFYETGSSYTKTFNPPSTGGASRTATTNHVTITPDTNIATRTIANENEEEWIRQNVLEETKSAENTGRTRSRANSLTSDEKKITGRVKVSKSGSSEKKRRKDDTFVRNEKCSTCNEAVGENNHTNFVTVYADSNNIEYKIGHRGQCKK